MKRFSALSLVVALAVSASTVSAEEVKSGLQAGDKIGAFYVTKLAGAEDDGVEVGKNLCYRCKNGNKPQVMVFTRSADAKVTSLVSGLDKLIADKSDNDLRAFVNVLGETKESATSEAEKVVKAAKAKNVPFVIPNEVENGPGNYGLNAKAEVTVIIANKGQVVANHAFGSAKEVDVKKVLETVNTSLK